MRKEDWPAYIREQKHQAMILEDEDLGNSFLSKMKRKIIYFSLKNKSLFCLNKDQLPRTILSKNRN